MQARYRVITVCTGNICRSPMAEAMLRRAFDDAGFGDRVDVDSAGTARWELGSPIDRRAAAVLARHGLRLDGHTARQFERPWFRDRDLILALDDTHFRQLREWAPDAQSSEKIHLLREFDPDARGEDQSVPDPWYGSSTDFERTWELIAAAVPGTVDYVATQTSGRHR